VEEKLNLNPSSPIILRAGQEKDEKLSGGRAMLNSVEVLVSQGKSYLRGRFHLYAPKGQIS
jgi:hypothetical protein